MPAETDHSDEGGFEQAASGFEKSNNFIRFIHLYDNAYWSEHWSTWPGVRPWEGRKPKKKLVVLWHARPVDPLAILSWRSGLIEVGDVAYRIVAVPKALPPALTWSQWFQDTMKGWAETAEKETSAFRVGNFVSHVVSRTDGQAAGHDPSFLTVDPSGKLAPILDALDECKRRFRTAIGQNVGERRERVLEHARKVIAFDGKRFRGNEDEFRQEENRIKDVVEAALKSERFWDVDRRAIPRVLLLGPSGCGKTLIARYLAWRTSPGKNEILFRPFQRVAIPAYLHKEDTFEFDVFGYCAGAYTDAPAFGSLGILLSILGGVVFFDEIGDASPEIQSKLLAYMDDYNVAPKGWVKGSIYCPTLIVAATNRPIEKWVLEADVLEKSTGYRYFRNDLFQRFDVILQIPSLEERKAELPFVVDAMLQDQAFNPDGVIKEIGEGALGALRDADFSRGNFRTLERIVRSACARARSGGRDYLVEADVIIATSDAEARDVRDMP